jgi:hypothetical protein
MLEARADNPPQTQPASTQPSSAPAADTAQEKKRFGISDGNETILVHAVSRKAGIHPKMDVKGPAKVSVVYYPVVRLKRFADINSVIPWTVRYKVKGEKGKPQEHRHVGYVRISNFRTPAIDHTRLTIGSAISFTVRIPKGKNEISFPFTNGFVLIQGTEPLSEEGTAARLAPKPSPPRKTVSRPVPRPAALRADEGKAIPRFTFEGEREWLHSMGSRSSSGDMNTLEAAARIRLRRDLALGIGVHASSYGLGIEEQAVRTTLRSYSAAASAGLVLKRGRHRLSAAANGGYRMMEREISRDLGPYSWNETTHGYEIGGRLEYGYGERLETAVSLSNNPFCPLSAKIRFEFPFSWRLWTEADILWLHTAIPKVEEGLKGGIILKENNVYARLMAGIPLWKRGKVMPSVLVGGSVNASETGHHDEDIAVGGELSIATGRFALKARGGAFILGKAPFLQMGISY